MLIEIHGGGFHNYGAQLMTITVIDKVTKRFPDAEFCVDGATGATFANRGPLNLMAVFPPIPCKPMYLRTIKPLANLFYRKSWKRNLGLVRYTDPNAFIDISGYAYGDSWGVNPLKHVLDKTAAFLRRKAPIVLMPQQLGPFTNPEQVDLAQRLFDRSDLVYARDQKSYDELKRVAPSGCTPKIAPDITIFQHDHAGTTAERYACIVPNERMLDKGGPQWREMYLDHLKLVALQIRKLGLHTRIVVHAPFGGDLRLAKKLQEQLADDQSVSFDDTRDPVRLKQVLAGATLVVGSRFHALVGALSTGVPVIALGWSHKYPQLLNDFGTPEYHFDSPESPDQLVDMVQRLASEQEQSRVREELKRRKTVMVDDNTRMWDEVYSVLENCC